MDSVATVYIITIIISIIIALILVKLTRSYGRATIGVEKEKKGEEPLSPEAVVEASLKQEIFEEIKECVDSKQQSQAAAERISSVFSKELEKKITARTQELTKKYESVINDKTQNEEIAWKKYNKVLSEKRETETVIRSIAEGLIVVDAKGKVVMINPAAEKLLGSSKKAKIGKSITEDMKEEQLFSLVKDSSGKEGREIELISQVDETKRVVRASTAVIENENGQTVGMVSVLSDITKQKELDQLKANFVANVSHELRTPLIAIDKSLFLILNKSAGPISPEQEQFLAIAERNLKRLAGLINDLLDLSKLEAGKFTLKRQLTVVAKVINESIEGLENWAKTKTITIKKKLEIEQIQADIDSDKVTQVLTNLIGNAIKFTPAEGKITIEALLHKENNEIIISVEDTGIGIPKENITKVFDKFYQAGERTSTDISGTGIGLSIAKEIVDLHGGKIWAESKEGRGVKFIFTLPLKNDLKTPEG